MYILVILIYLSFAWKQSAADTLPFQLTHAIFILGGNFENFKSHYLNFDKNRTLLENIFVFHERDDKNTRNHKYKRDMSRVKEGFL